MALVNDMTVCANKLPSPCSFLLLRRLTGTGLTGVDPKNLQSSEDTKNLPPYLRSLTMKVSITFAATIALVLNQCQQISAACSDNQPIILGFGSEEVYEFPPTGSESKCGDCDFVQYRVNETITYDTKDNRNNDLTVSFKLSDIFSDENDLVLFTELCEEAWILADYQSQIAAIRGEFTHEVRGLCFGDNDYSDEFNTQRGLFIFDLCLGNSDGVDQNDVNAILDNLSDQVEELEAKAEDDARRQTFDSSNDLAGQLAEASTCTNGATCAQLCRDIQTCFQDTATGLQSIFEDLDEQPDLDSAFGDDFLFTTCFDESIEDLNTAKEDACNSGNNGEGCSPYNFKAELDGFGQTCTFGPIPFCPADLEEYFTPFPPAYPDPDLNPDYNTAVASIKALFFCQAGGVPDFTDRTDANAVGVIIILRALFQALDIVATVLNDTLPDDLLYAWKVIALLATKIVVNSFEIVLAQADFHDALVDGAEIEAVYENTKQILDTTNTIFGQVACVCSEETSLRGQGCDGVDNDCDRQVDECDEDNFSPEVFISPAAIAAAKSTYFADVAEAQEFLAAFVTAQDDCDASPAVTIAVSSSDSCSATFLVSAEDRCGNDSGSVSFPVKIDDSPPTVSCTIGAEMSSLSFVTWDNVTKIVNPGLSFQVEDECGEDVAVTVEVFGNQVVKDAAYLYLNGTNLGVYLENDYCRNRNIPCVVDSNLDGRLYTVVVSASDKAGNTASAECQVLIPGDDGGNPAGSTQRFLLDSYSLSANGGSLASTTAVAPV